MSYKSNTVLLWKTIVPWCGHMFACSWFRVSSTRTHSKHSRHTKVEVPYLFPLLSLWKPQILVPLQIGLTSAAEDPAHLHKWQLGLARCLKATKKAKEGMSLLEQALGQQQMPQETKAAMLRLLVELQVRSPGSQ